MLFSDFECYTTTVEVVHVRYKEGEKCAAHSQKETEERKEDSSG